MTQPWPCRCGAAGVKNLAAYGYCAGCLTALYRRLSPAAFDGVGVGVAVSAVDELGDFQLECVLCGASWWGRVGDRCKWCRAALARQLIDQRHRLLYPDWISEQGPTYDSLSSIDRRVWDATRGIDRGAESLSAWACRLVDAVAAGIIGEADAQSALARVEQRRDR
jgi:hypothetical protein